MSKPRTTSNASSATAPVSQSRFNFGKKKDVQQGEKTAVPAVSADGNVMQDPLRKQSTSDIATVDAVWGEISEDGPDYRALGWLRASVIGIKSTIGIGVLGLPTVLNDLGWVPGILIIIGVAAVTTWTAIIIGKFKLRHPEIYTLADVGQLMLGPIGREVFGLFYWLHITAVAGSGLLSFSVALNAVSLHATCTVVGLILGFVLSSIQTLNKISWIGWTGLISIMAAIITVCVAVGVQDRPSEAPQEGPWTTDTATARHPGFITGMNALNTAVFAFSVTPYYFNIIGEMKEPKHFSRTAYLTQGFVTATYLAISVVVYYFCGQYLASPALGSAGPLLKRIAYGIAIPGLLASIVMSTHMPAKYLFVRFMRNSKHLARNTKTHYIVWYSIVAFNISISFVLALGIPVFNNLLSLIGALLGSFICLIAETYMWMYDNWNPARRTTGWAATFFITALIHVLGWFIMIAGTYAAVVGINDALNEGNTTQPFSCADNSNSV